MATEIVYTRVPPAEVAALCRSIPAVLAGIAPDPHGIASGFKARCAFAAISLVKEAFEEKGRGGTGSDGIKWAPLKQRTVERKLAKGMSDSQLKQWKSDFRFAFRELAGHMNEGDAREKAQALATGQHENRTGRLVPTGSPSQIGVDTGIMRQSLSIGSLTERGPDATYSPPNEEQHYKADQPGEMTIGTTVPYARYFHAGTKRGQPARPLWPEKFPKEWVDEISRQARVGIERIIEIVRG